MKSVKKTKYISYFDNYKKLHTLRKKRSPIIIEFRTDDPEEWFITVIHYKRTDGKISESFMILRDEVEDRILFYKNLGYEKDENLN